MAETELSRAYLQTDTCYSEDDIAAIGDDGILFSDGCKASFAACAETYVKTTGCRPGAASDAGTLRRGALYSTHCRILR